MGNSEFYNLYDWYSIRKPKPKTRGKAKVKKTKENEPIVVCDETNNLEDDREEGKMNIDILYPLDTSEGDTES